MIKHITILMQFNALTKLRDSTHYGDSTHYAECAHTKPESTINAWFRFVWKLSFQFYWKNIKLEISNAEDDMFASPRVALRNYETLLAISRDLWSTEPLN